MAELNTLVPYPPGVWAIGFQVVASVETAREAEGIPLDATPFPPVKRVLRFVQLNPSVLVLIVVPFTTHKPFEYATFDPETAVLPVHTVPSVEVAIEFPPEPTATHKPAPEPS